MQITYPLVPLLASTPVLSGLAVASRNNAEANANTVDSSDVYAGDSWRNPFGVRTKNADIASYSTANCSQVDRNAAYSKSKTQKLPMPEGKCIPFTHTTSYLGVNWGTSPHTAGTIKAWASKDCSGPVEGELDYPGQQSMHDEPLAGQCIGSSDRSWNSVMGVGYPS